MIQASKSTRYDVFKNDNSNFPVEQQQVTVKKDDPFQDFAKAAFSEFSNKLSGAQSFQPFGSSKVIFIICVVTFDLISIICKNCLATNNQPFTFILLTMSVVVLAVVDFFMSIVCCYNIR
jgi:hypothetical protein